MNLLQRNAKGSQESLRHSYSCYEASWALCKVAFSWGKRHLSVAALACSKCKNAFAPRPSAEPEGPRQAVNVTRGTVLATRLEVAGTGPSRTKGLLGRDCLMPGEGLWIVPCEAVHTFFMRFPIDLVYLDRKKQIKKLCSNVSAWRMSACLTAHSVIELPAGVIRETQTRPGDAVEIGPAPTGGSSS